MTTVNIYLIFDGNCEEAFLFYQSVFGGEIPYMGKYKDMPIPEGMPPLPDHMKERIMHVGLPISKETMLSGSDAGGEWADKVVKGDNFSISITTDSKEEAERLFYGLSAGGQITMPLNVTFWGDYFGMFTDKFDVKWMVSFAAQQQK